MVPPFRKPPRQQLTKEFSGADAGVKVTAPPGIVFFRFIISMFGTVQGEFHETREGQNSVFGDFAPNDVNQPVHNENLARR